MCGRGQCEVEKEGVAGLRRFSIAGNELIDFTPEGLQHFVIFELFFGGTNTVKRTPATLFVDSPKKL